MCDDPPGDRTVPDRIEISSVGLPLAKIEHGGPGLSPEYEIAVALSGGGNRAALFGLGVLMATKDAGKMPRTISSVSGGSITNMMLAQRLPALSDTSIEKWDEATEEVFHSICQGSITPFWLGLLLGYMVLPPVGLLTLAFSNRLPAPVPLLVLASAWLSVLVMRGVLIENLMGRRYLGQGWRARTLSTLVQDPASSTHIFSATDLGTGRPVHFMTPNTVFQRTDDPKGGGLPSTVLPFDGATGPNRYGERHEGYPEVPLSAILRATAGFPGIPPRMFRWNRYQGKMGGGSRPPARSRLSEGRDLARHSFLSDGGIWNNLATDTFDDGSVPFGTPFVVLVSDASGPLKPIRTFLLTVPGIAEIVALARQGQILSANTVSPRSWARRENLFAELRTPAAQRFRDARLFPVVSSSETPKQLVERFREDLESPQALRYEETGLGIPERFEAVQSRLQEAEAMAKELEQLESWSVLASKTPLVDAVAQFPTTLSSVDPCVALKIVSRGYYNAALTLYLSNLSATFVRPRGWLAERNSRTCAR
jgi:hypothetical protein